MDRHRDQPEGGDQPEDLRQQIIESIESKLKNLSAKPKDRFIHAVPDNIRKTHKEAFSPKHFCIGPFHRGKQSEAMEKHKLRYLDSFLGPRPNRLNECVEAIHNLEVQTRQCYSEKIDLDSKNFVTMVLEDGAFIIELFLLNHFPKKRAPNDIIFNPQKKWMIAEVRRDLNLMENQLPFFVLEELFVFASKTQSGELPSLLKLAYDFFQVGTIPIEKLDRISKSDVKHLLDALRSWYLPTDQVPRVSSSERIEAIPGAKQLRAAGVEFKKSNSNCLFEIKFSRDDGELKIPCFKLFHEIESFLRNMTAFERSCYGDDSYFIDYVAFLGDLINTRADAKLLIKENIINIDDWWRHDKTMTEDEALANLFNSFGNESRFWMKNADFCTLRHALKTYRRTPLHKLKFCI